MNYNELRDAIVEVIRTNGNEEITGEVLQYVLLEMVSGLGEGYAFKGVATPSIEPAETDANIFYIGGAGTYRNFSGANADVPEGSIVFFVWNGTWTATQIAVTKPIDAEIVENSENPVAGGAVFAAMQSLTNAGYVLAGVALPATEPPAQPDAKIYYFATEAGLYTNFGTGITLPAGLSIIKYNGSAWSASTLFRMDVEPTAGSANMLSSGAIFTALDGKVDKEAGKGLSDENFTAEEKAKLGVLPTAEQLAVLFDGKQDALTFDNTPTENSANPVKSGGVYAANREIVGQLSGIAFTANKSVINVGEQGSVTLMFTSDIDASTITIKRGAYVLAVGSGRSLSAISVENPTDAGTITYSAVAVINGVERTKECTVQKVFPVMYGAGASAADIVAKGTPRLTPTGRYPITVTEDGQYVFVLVAPTMQVSFVTLGGLELPMEAPTGTTVDGASYLAYRSSNALVAGSYYINVYE